MKVLFSAFEAAPYAKAGGLGDVAGSLPAALAAAGVDARLIMPKYRVIPAEYANQMRFLCSFYVNIGGDDKYAGFFELRRGESVCYFIDNEEYFGGGSLYGYGEREVDKAVFFAYAALEAAKRADFMPNIFHCNDWHTALIPVLLKTSYRGQYPQAKAVMTIHNLRYQGLFGIDRIKNLSGLDDSLFGIEGLEFYGGASLLKGGIVFADCVTTVSPTYARETLSPEYGERLDGVLRMRERDYRGILNGLDYDSYSPWDDPDIAQNYSPESMAGKEFCKHKLQTELGLAREIRTPLLSVVSRLVPQKGMDLIMGCAESLIYSENFQLAVLGTGDERYEDFFAYLAGKYPGKVAFCRLFDEKLSRRIYSGSDMLLMPSEFEPCGLSQLIAMRYGTLALVRETGGLRDTVCPYNEADGSGYGFTFGQYGAEAFADAVRYALSIYRDRPLLWQTLVRRAMALDFSWNKSALEYAALYHSITA